MAAPLQTASTTELLTEQVQRVLVQPLQIRSSFLAAGPVIVDSPRPVRFPKIGLTSAGFYGEGEAIYDLANAGSTSALFDEVTLLPTTMKSIKSLITFSNELLRQSVVALDAALQNRLVVDIARALDFALYSGNGGTPAGTQPVGFTNWTGVQEMAGIGAITIDHLHDALGLLLGVGIDPAMGSVRWVLRPETWTDARKLKDGYGRYLLEPDPTQAGAFRLLGIPVTLTDRLPVAGGTTSMGLIDFSQVAVVRDNEPTVKILDQTFAGTDSLGIRVTCRYDTAPLQARAVVRLDGVTL
jgi:HK97 family phage major capsid protein